MPSIAKEALKRVGYPVYLFPVMAIEWILFKCCYPYADYFTDSYSYIQAAAHRDAIGYRPIGYSIFLRAVHWVWVSDTFLVTLQYILVQGALVGMVLWLRRWCSLGEGVSNILFSFLVLNPLIPYVCNYVSSDALFIGLSLIWLTVLMDLLRKPSWWGLIAQIVLLFVIFHLRYMAMYYPAVAALMFLLAKKAKPVLKLAGVAGSIGVIGLSIGLVRQVTHRETGVAIFSAFSGWQIANNALNMYPFIHEDTAGLPSPECRKLAVYVHAYFEKTGHMSGAKGEPVGGVAEGGVPAAGVPIGGTPAGAESANTDYMWVRSSPLHTYLDDVRKGSGVDYFTAWNRVAPVFTQYGYFLIRHHPLAYARYYIWHSAEGFFWSPLDVFSVYNEGKMTVDPEAGDWFHYNTLQPRLLSATLQGRLLAPMPAIYLALNIAFFLATVLFLSSRVCRERYVLFTRCLRLAAAYLLANACFCIVASPSVFRYQVLPMIVLFLFTISEIYCLTFRHGQILEPSPARDRRNQ